MIHNKSSKGLNKTLLFSLFTKLQKMLSVVFCQTNECSEETVMAFTFTHRCGVR